MEMNMVPALVVNALRQGVVIPAMPLALTANRSFDERRQRAICRYYAAAGAGGIAVGVHTTQFAIRDPEHGLFEPVLALAAEEMDRADRNRDVPLIRIAGICGRTEQAIGEAETACRLGYHFGLLSLAALASDDDATRIAHCRRVADVIPIFGFYLQRAVGGPSLSYRFWREFATIERVAAIKIAPFNRYQTIDVVRAIAEEGREDVALYTGNDDCIVVDLLTPYRFVIGDRVVERRIAGGLLGHWSVWTRRAVELLQECHAAVAGGGAVSAALLQRAVEVTDANAAFFDAANGFAGCIAGLHDVLRRQGLLAGVWTLDPDEGLSPGQAAEIERVYRAYPHLNDDEFVAAGRDEWLNG
jgi:dihydrodipicolinate synthase/N-acetylneuraminate lyase